VTRAVFFDVDFTLIYPGAVFRGEGYDQFCRRHGISIDVTRFNDAVASAAPILDNPDNPSYSADIFVRYTRHIIEHMGGRGASLDACAREIYAEWAACQHFELYDDVAPALRELDAAGIRIGLISNSHRCLASFQSHFELEGLIAGAVSSSEHGLMKPHPSIFRAALDLVNVRAAESVMVGDSLRQDVEGALRVGMRAILLDRATRIDVGPDNVPVIRSLIELPPLVLEAIQEAKPSDVRR
jgi:HAD superfamily hydrolase (TIGR01662 family)